VEAVARTCQQAAINDTRLRLVVTAPAVRRVLSIEGLDRLVSIYPSLESAIVSEVPGGSVPTSLEADPLPPSRFPAGFASASGAAGITPVVLWQLIDALGDGLVLTGEDGKIALVNRRCAEMFGYKREELIGLPVDSLVPSDVRAAHPDYRASYSQAPQARPMSERTRLAGLRKDVIWAATETAK
jgi:PAS domain S-box-containing protein